MSTEIELRRPGWSEGHWLKLGDGRFWCLPRLEFKPDLDLGVDGARLMAECKTIPEFPGYVKVLLEANGVGQTAYVIRHMVARLLRENYTLDEASSKALLPFGIDGVDPGFEGGVLGDAMDALDEVFFKPGRVAAILGITPPGVN